MLYEKGAVELPSFEGDASAQRCKPERFVVARDRLVRHVSLRQGGETKSELRLQSRRSLGTDLAAEYDLAWLTSKTAPPEVSSSRGSLRAADLFSGCGGLSVGLREACRALNLSAEFAFASDFNDAALDVYCKNFRPHFSASGPLEQVVDGKVGARRTKSEVDLMSRVGRLDFVIAGPPCQGHSDLNNHTRREDPKNQLVIRVARFVELFRPRHVLIENVQGIRHDKLGSLGRAMEVLARLGYRMDDRVVNADRLGAPQARKRFFLLASLSEVQGLDLGESEIEQPRSLGWAINDLLDRESDTAFDSSAVHSAVNRKRIDYLFDHQLFELPNSERPPCHRDREHSYTGVYGRMRWDRPGPTITTGFGSAGQGRFVHPLRRRTLTPHEAARVQFFPDFFDFGDRGRRQYQELIGNAVPSKLAYAIILNQLR